MTKEQQQQRQQLIIKNVFEIQNKLYEIQELQKEIHENISKAEYDDEFLSCSDVIPSALNELFTTTQMKLVPNYHVAHMSYKNIEAYIHSFKPANEASLDSLNAYKFGEEIVELYKKNEIDFNEYSITPNRD